MCAELLLLLCIKTQFPKDLILAEFWGAFDGMASYFKATKQVEKIVKEHGWQTG